MIEGICKIVCDSVDDVVAPQMCEVFNNFFN